MDDGRDEHLSVMRSVNERHLLDTPGVAEVWLLRHADAYARLKTYEGDPRDPALSPEGRVQAGLLADRLAGIPLRAVRASGLRRAQETAAVVAARHGLDVVTDPRLREVRTDWDDGRPGALRPAGVYPFPEPEAEVAERMRAAVAAAVAGQGADDGTTPRVAVVGHDAALLVLLGSLLGLRWGQLSMVLPLTSVSVVAVKGERMVVRSIGDATHLVREPSGKAATPSGGDG